MYLAQLRQAAMNLPSAGGSSLVDTTKAQYASKTRDVPLGEVFGKIDTNGDGVVSRDEFNQAKSSVSDEKVAEALASLKTGSTASLVSMLQSTGRAGSASETGKSKGSTQSSSLSDSLFGSIDANQDGIITQDEFTSLGLSSASGHSGSGGSTAAASQTATVKSSATNPYSAEQNMALSIAAQNKALMQQAISQYSQLARTRQITGSFGASLFTG